MAALCLRSITPLSPKVLLAASSLFVLDSVDAGRAPSYGTVSLRSHMHCPFTLLSVLSPLRRPDFAGTQLRGCGVSHQIRTRWGSRVHLSAPPVPRQTWSAHVVWWSDVVSEADHLVRRRRPLHFGRRRRADVDVDVDVGGGSRRSIRNSVRPGGHVAAGRGRSTRGARRKSLAVKLSTQAQTRWQPSWPLCGALGAKADPATVPQLLRRARTCCLRPLHENLPAHQKPSRV